MDVFSRWTHVVTPFFINTLQHDHDHLVRTTQQTMQSVLALRALVLRGRTIVRLHTLREERGKRRNTVNLPESRQKYIFTLGARDVDGLSDARVRIQPR